MSRDSDAQSLDTAITIDVLIIGGGVQGLWLLDELSARGYSVLLLERRDLGGEQTCHSHVYIHQGHLYQDDQGGLTEHLRQIAALWSEWLAVRSVRRAIGPSCFGFQNPADAKQKTDLWQLLRLPVEPMPLPPVLHGGVVRVTYRTEEECLIGESLVDALRHGHDDAIARVNEIESIGVEAVWGPRGQAEHVVSVVARMDTHRVWITPGALVLTAGAGNQALLDLAAGGRRPASGRTTLAQQIRLAHMLVLKGNPRWLPPLTGIFPKLTGLFVVSRTGEDDPPETVWLVSDNQSPLMMHAEDWLWYDARWWLKSVLHALLQLAPQLFTRESLDALRWGVYSAPKAEGRAGGVLPEGPDVAKCGFDNLWAIWPTKLTLAPLASRLAADQISRQLPRRSGRVTHPALPAACYRRPATALERWRITPTMPWREFVRHHAIDYMESPS